MSSRPRSPRAAHACSERGFAITTRATRSCRCSTSAPTAAFKAAMIDGDSGGSTVRGGPDGCIDTECSLTASPYDRRRRRYGSNMTALTLEAAKNTGIGVAVGLIALMLLTAFVIKNVTVKLVSILIIGGFSFCIWTQRSSLQECADKVGARAATRDTTELTCSFLGSDVTVSALP